MKKIDRYDVLGIGAPVIDNVITVSESFLASIPGKKGGAVQIEHAALLHLIKSCNMPPLTIAGGSGANTIKGLAHLGNKCALAGKIGNDPSGDMFIKTIQSLGIFPLLSKSSKPTTEVLTLVTPDGERTMRFFPGASLEMNPGDLHPRMFQGIKLVHIEGYTLLNPYLTETAMKLAKEGGAKISFDCASFEIIQDNKALIDNLLSKYINILFANEKESQILTGLDPKKACQLLANTCDIAVILNGKEGSWIGHKNEVIHSPTIPVIPKDTTGAGDLYASGFLHGYLHGKDLMECGKYGSLLGAAVVDAWGAEIPIKTWESIKQKIQ
jgi:sugar/nucleoside kinase (ribokinase family)